MKLLPATLFFLIAFASPLSAQPSSQGPKNIILIGGPSGSKSEGPLQHDWPAGIALIEQYLKTSPDIQAMKNVSINAYPDGWPSDRRALEGASTIVMYFGGLENHPLYDAKQRAQFDALMKRGVGLVALHQATTLKPNDALVDLPQALGGARYGMVDRANEMIAFTPARHPISNGVRPFAYKDEFYGTVRFGAAKTIPILTTILHAEDGYDSAKHATITRTVGWAFERPGGGRAFGFTGLHYLFGLDQPDLRKLLLNAIVWTAGIDVPNDGIQSGPPTGVAGGIVRHSNEAQVLPQPWGELRWFTSAELGNSATMKTGQATIRPGQQNPRHYHPNCDEILRVLQGHILNTIGDKSSEMGPGDVSSVPQGILHNAKNIGTDDAVLAISYSSAYCRNIGE